MTTTEMQRLCEPKPIRERPHRLQGRRLRRVTVAAVGGTREMELGRERRRYM